MGGNELKRYGRILLVLGAAAGALAAASAKSPANGDWPMYSHDLAGTRYSPLIQINTNNVARLKQAWTFRLNAVASEATPIVVNGVMYLPAGKRIVALEPETGHEIWSYEPPMGQPSRRGVTYWPGDTNNPPRILSTVGKMMIALNANTGKIDPG